MAAFTMENESIPPNRQIYLFGALRVYQEEHLFPLSGEKSRNLLAHLVLNPRLPHYREKLADMLYMDTSTDRIRRNFSDTLYRLQKALGSDWLIVERDRIALHVNEHLWVDVWEFERLAGSDQEGDLQKAVDLYTGDLLPELYDDWLVAERELYRNQYLSALERLAAVQENNGELHHALLTLRRLVAAEPLHEPAHQSYLRLLGRLQRYGEALVHYEYLRGLMRSELDAEPLEETRLIAESIEQERDLATVQTMVEERLPFIGRITERTSALLAVEAMLKGRGSILAIEGEAGIGKTRLLREIAASVRWRGATLLQGLASEIPSVSPFSPLIEALAPLINSRGVHLEALLTAETLAALAPIYANWNEKAILNDIPPQQASNRFYSALQTFGETLARLTPTVLVLDDLQWADPVLWKSLERFAQGLAQGGALFIVVYRRPEIEHTPGWEVIQTWDRAGLLKSISLQPLNVEEVAQLVGDAHPVDPAEVYAWTGGNPFYLSEWLATPGSTISTRHNTTSHRLQTLSPTARSAIESACILGDNIPYRLWTEISDLPPVTLAGLSDELVAQRWLQPSIFGYAFTHDLVRTAVFNEIEPIHRRFLHERAARAYQALEPENLRGQAFHFDQANLKSEAAFLYIQAGEQDIARFAYDEAASSFARALTLLPPDITLQRVETALSLGRACEVIGDRFQQRPALKEAMLGARKLRNPALLLQVLLATALATIRTNQNAEAEGLLSEAISLAQQLQDSKSETEVLLLMGMNETNLLRSENAKRHYTNALRLARKISDPSCQARALRGLGTAARDLGDPNELIKWLEQSLLVQHQIGDHMGEVVTRSNLITAYYDMAAWDRVLAIAIDVLPKAVELRMRSVSAYVRELQALAYYSLGDFSSARTMFLQVEQDFVSVGDQRGAGLAHDCLGLIAEAKGEYEEALRFYSDALAVIELIEGATEAAIVQHDLGALLLKLERPAEAIQLLKTAYSGWMGKGNELVRLKSGAFLGLACLALNDRLQAWELAVEGWEAFQAGTLIGEQPQGWLWALYNLLTELEQCDSAQMVLQAAYAELQRQAFAISNEDLRHSFFYNVPLNLSILQEYDRIYQTSRFITIALAHRDAPLGRLLREDEYVSVQWAVSAPEDEAIINKTVRRRYRLKRLLQQAEKQNAAPTDEDLAQALGVSRRTILRDMQILSQEIPRPPTRKRK